MGLRKLNYNVLLKTMSPMEADIVAGRAKSVSAQHYALYEMDAMADKYEKAWDMFRANGWKLSITKNRAESL